MIRQFGHERRAHEDIIDPQSLCTKLYVLGSPLWDILMAESQLVHLLDTAVLHFGTNIHERLLNKPYVNEVTLTGQNLSLKCL